MSGYETDSPPSEKSRRTLSALTARRGLAMVAVGAVLAAGATVFLSDGFSTPEKITTHATASGPATDGPVSASSFGAADPGACLQWTPTDDPETDRQDLAEVSCADP
ncbi:MAG: hypothetical protein WBG53_03390, partial [Rhodococcus sp. (in: high G+C Gram-positive bacteria)]